MADEVLYEVAGGVATLTLNRPDRLNAQTPELFELALRLLDQAANDPEVRVVVLTGAGRAFCAGGDLSRMNGDAEAASPGTIPATTPPPPLPRTARVRALRELTRTSQLLYEMPKITIAAINGACAGGGMSWALACDLRYAAASARFSTAFVNAGLSGDFGLTWLLPRVVGAARARELCFFGDVVGAQQARADGLVHEVFDDAELMGEVVRRAALLTEKSPGALAGLKANLNEGATVEFGPHLERESARLIDVIGSPDNIEAARAFLEKRKPSFGGS
ncbi:MAG: enoyl-CoA hydratase/isomerase family protein [Acidimicrobiales bacterium]